MKLSVYFHELGFLLAILTVSRWDVSIFLILVFLCDPHGHGLALLRVTFMVVFLPNDSARQFIWRGMDMNSCEAC